MKNTRNTRSSLVPDLLVDESHLKQPHDPTYGLKLWDNSLYVWHVKLKFKQFNSQKHLVPKVGTGFFINITDSKYDIILTAGHNLIGTDGEYSQDLEIQGPAVEKGYKIIRRCINDAFIKNPNENTKNDYGAILLKRGANPRAGFGFSLLEAFKQPGGIEARVSGYPRGSQIGEMNMSSGLIIEHKSDDGKIIEEILHYKIETIVGMSGSPVWVPYEGYHTVIGIHTHGPGQGCTASRGPFLNFKVLTDVFAWAKVGYCNRALKASFDHNHSSWSEQHHPNIPEPLFSSLYLEFSLKSGNQAIVCIGHKILGTVFDIIPAHSISSSLPDHQLRYVFKLKGPQDLIDKYGCYVRWDSKTNTIDLVKKLVVECLICIMRPNDSLPAKLVHVPKQQDTLEQLLQIDANYIVPSDFNDDEDFIDRSNDLSFTPNVTNLKHKNNVYNHFSFPHVHNPTNDKPDEDQEANHSESHFYGEPESETRPPSQLHEVFSPYAQGVSDQEGYPECEGTRAQQSPPRPTRQSTAYHQVSDDGVSDNRYGQTQGWQESPIGFYDNPQEVDPSGYYGDNYGMRQPSPQFVDIEYKVPGARGPYTNFRRVRGRQTPGESLRSPNPNLWNENYNETYHNYGYLREEQLKNQIPRQFTTHFRALNDRVTYHNRERVWVGQSPEELTGNFYHSPQPAPHPSQAYPEHAHFQRRQLLNQRQREPIAHPQVPNTNEVRQERGGVRRALEGPQRNIQEVNPTRNGYDQERRPERRPKKHSIEKSNTNRSTMNTTNVSSPQRRQPSSPLFTPSTSTNSLNVNVGLYYDAVESISDDMTQCKQHSIPREVQEKGIPTEDRVRQQCGGETRLQPNGMSRQQPSMATIKQPDEMTRRQPDEMKRKQPGGATNQMPRMASREGISNYVKVNMKEKVAAAQNPKTDNICVEEEVKEEEEEMVEEEKMEKVKVEVEEEEIEEEEIEEEEIEEEEIEGKEVEEEEIEEMEIEEVVEKEKMEEVKVEVEEEEIEEEEIEGEEVEEEEIEEMEIEEEEEEDAAPGGNYSTSPQPGLMSGSMARSEEGNSVPRVVGEVEEEEIEEEESEVDDNITLAGSVGALSPNQSGILSR